MDRKTLCALVLLLGGCAAARLGDVPELENSGVTVTDQRPAEARARPREPATTPLVVLGDEDFDTSPVLHLQHELVRQKPAGIPTVALVLKRFTLADYYPRRVSSAGRTDLIADFLGRPAPADAGKSDAILCLLEGTLNGQPVKVGVREPYEVAPFGASVRTHPAWTAAVRRCIAGCAARALATGSAGRALVP